MKKLVALIAFISTCFSACSQDDCIQGTNELPMYGSVKRCKYLLESDKEFIAGCDKTFPSRDSAVRHHVRRGWEYLQSGDLSTSMKRFNQAWLLDSTKADIYWGFGAVLGKKKNYKESIVFFERALKLKMLNESAMLKGNIYRDASLSYANLFMDTKDKQYLKTAITYLNTSLGFNADNPLAYHDLVVCYYFDSKKDSARKYLAITNKYDTTLIPPDLRSLVKQ